ncbi:MAG TPA: hypothetical protein VFZ65_17085 [Planctomycetota bacterium]|nr:hypothetical protein [Planctomycetota bacterium]
MSGNSSEVSRLLARAPAVLLAGGVSFVCVADLWPGSHVRETVAEALQDPERAMAGHGAVDELFGRRLSPGNTWLRFEGFRGGLDGDGVFLTQVYYRGNYIAWPRRVFVADPSVVVNDGEPMAAASEPPGPERRQALGVRWVVVIARSPAGVPSIDVQGPF